MNNINLTQKTLNESMKQTFQESTTVTDLEAITEYANNLELKLGAIIFIVFSFNILFLIIGLINTKFKIEFIKEMFRQLANGGNAIIVFILFFINLNFLVSYNVINYSLSIIVLLGIFLLFYIYKDTIINYINKFNK